MPRVLVVDDEQPILTSTTLLLQGLGFETRGVDAADQALGVLKEWSPDIVLQDVRMPGLDLVRHVRQLREARPSTRIILFSAGMELAERAQEVSADGALEKPFRPHELLAALTEIAPTA